MAAQVDMVEVSPANRKKQWETLRCERGTGGSDAQPAQAAACPAESASQGQAVPPAEDARLTGMSGFGNVKVCFMRWLSLSTLDAVTGVVVRTPRVY